MVDVPSGEIDVLLRNVNRWVRIERHAATIGEVSKHES
jgi:hypothetical protein